MAIKNIIILFFLFFLSTLRADALSNKPFIEKPLYEFGFFVGSFSLPDYPASDQSRIRTIPAPLVHYHGDIFRSDDENGTRFRFINNDNFDFDLSFGGSFPTDTGNNQARTGMPELDWTAEIGPRLLYYFYRDYDTQIRLGFPIRTSFATDFIKWYSVGYVVAPTFQIDKYNFIAEKLDLYFIFTPTYLSEHKADYFFQIDPQYQTSERQAYDAKSGFLGTEISLALKYRWGSKNILIGSQYSDYSQSANTLSYLHRNRINWSYLVAFSWIFFESEELGTK